MAGWSGSADAARDAELDVVASSKDRLYDGLILSTVGLRDQDAHLLQVNHPIVLLGESISGGPLDHVGMPNVAGSRTAVEHLIAQGCRRIAIFDRPRTDESGPEDQRLRGYLDALDAAGIATDPLLQFPIDTFSVPEGVRAASTAVRSGPPFDGAFCPTDEVAVGVLRGLADSGVRVPHDVLVVGFDNLPMSEFTVPRLSTVAPDHRVTAETAVRFLLERIQKTVSDEPREFTTPFDLVVRESSSRR